MLEGRESLVFLEPDARVAVRGARAEEEESRAAQDDREGVCHVEQHARPIENGCKREATGWKGKEELENLSLAAMARP